MPSLDRDRVTFLLRSRGWNISKLATIADVPKRQVRRVLYGYGTATPSVLQRIAEALDVGVERITAKEEDAPP
jgi:transcriptional regulator with XRE-family HTH domain